MEHFKLKKQFCPRCFSLLDGCTNVFSDSLPADGDITVCFYCGSILQFGPDLDFTILSLEDIADPEQRVILRKLQAAVEMELVKRGATRWANNVRSRR
jgi:hypothetical protein